MSMVETAGAGADILLRRDVGGVATLTLNRPQQYNALSAALLDALQSTLTSIAAQPAVRVVIIAGAGKAFCAGHDLKEMRADPRREAIEQLFSSCAQVMLTITRMPQPVIARVHGIATAAGCQLVAQCDLAVAADSARFATSGVNLGLFCNTPGVALARNVSRKMAMEMLLTGEFIDAPTALAQGLVNRVVPMPQIDEEIARFAESIVRKTPVAISAGKRTFYQQVEAGLEQSYALASSAMVSNMMTHDAPEGIDAFIQKRAPHYTGD